MNHIQCYIALYYLIKIRCYQHVACATMADMVCHVHAILSRFSRQKHLNPPHCRVQGEAMRSLQVFSHQCDPISSFKVAHIDALHHGL